MASAGACQDRAPAIPEAWKDVDEQAELTRIVIEEHGEGDLHSMHRRSLQGLIDGTRLLRSSAPYAQHRKEAVQFLAKQFEEFHLKDGWLVATITLLDRVAATQLPLTLSQTPLRCLGSMASVSESKTLALMMAAALCVLKLSSSEAELGCFLKDLIFKLSGWRHPDQILWHQIRDAELRIYRLLNFQVASPCVADINARIAMSIYLAVTKKGDCPDWNGLCLGRLASQQTTTPRFVALSGFLVELGLAHLPSEIYSDMSTPLTFALAATKLAMHAFGRPPASCIAALEAAEREALNCEGPSCLSYTQLTTALYLLWKSPLHECRVVRKWRLRAERGLLALPPAPPHAEVLQILQPAFESVHVPAETRTSTEAEALLLTPQRRTSPRGPRTVWNDVRAVCLALPCGSTVPLQQDEEKSIQAKDGSCIGPAEDELRRRTLYKREINGAGDQPNSLKAVRKRQKVAIAIADALHGEERDRAVEVVAQTALTSLEQNCPDEMVRDLVEAMGLLTAPQEVSLHRDSGVTMTDRAKAEIRAANQTRLRTVLLRLLGVWGKGGLDMTDSGTAKLLCVPFERLHYLIQGRRLDYVACRDQWIALASVVGLSSKDQEVQTKTMHVGEAKDFEAEDLAKPERLACSHQNIAKRSYRSMSSSPSQVHLPPTLVHPPSPVRTACVGISMKYGNDVLDLPQKTRQSFTGELDPCKCIARVWRAGRGGQCQKSMRNAGIGARFCPTHAKHHGHGTVDGPIPEGKLREFQMKILRPSPHPPLGSIQPRKRKRKAASSASKFKWSTKWSPKLLLARGVLAKTRGLAQRFAHILKSHPSSPSGASEGPWLDA